MAASPQERERLMVQKRHEVLAQTSSKQHLCTHCAFMLKHCVCEKLKQLSPDQTVKRPVDFIVHMHIKERYRSSNTGKVLEKIYETPVYIDSDPSDMAKMADTLQARRDDCLVLYPSDGSLTVAELKELGKLPENPLILVPDATWNQAKRLVRNFPQEIQRVKIEPKTLSTFLCRTQAQADRVCTVEAVSMLLEDLGHNEESRRILDGLKVVQSAFNMQLFHKEERPANRLKKKPRIGDSSS
jgi:DTW domain-containing protein YfiP